MLKGCTRKSSSKEVYYSTWSEGKQTLEIADGFLVMLTNNVDLLIIEDKRSKAREEDRVGVHLLDLQTCCRITSVRPSHSSV